MLAFVVMSTMVADSMPNSSVVVPRICMYFFLIFVLCSLSLVVNIFICNIQGKRVPLPGWVKRIVVVKGLATVLCMSKQYRLQPDDHTATKLNITCDQGDEEKKQKNCGVFFKSDAALLKQIVEPKSLLQELQFITRKLRELDQMSTVADDWRFVARVLDRLSVIAFFVCMITATVVMFSQRPRIMDPNLQRDFDNAMQAMHENLS